MVPFETEAPGGHPRLQGKISTKNELIPPVVNPLAYNDNTISSTPFNRRYGFTSDLALERPFPITRDVDRDMTAGLAPHRCRPGPVANVGGFAVRRGLVLVVPEMLGHLLVQRRFQTVLVNCLSSPSDPVSDKPCSLANRTSSAATAASADGGSALFFARIAQSCHLGASSPSVRLVSRAGTPIWRQSQIPCSAVLFCGRRRLTDVRKKCAAIIRRRVNDLAPVSTQY